MLEIGKHRNGITEIDNLVGKLIRLIQIVQNGSIHGCPEDLRVISWLFLVINLGIHRFLKIKTKYTQEFKKQIVSL